ncbi:SCO family protein [soil metagenome]
MYQTVFSKINLIIAVMMLIGCSSKQTASHLPYYNQPDFTPLFLSSSQANNAVPHTIGSFSFTDQHGKLITDNDVKGKIHIANFMFTACGSICPVMTKHLKLLQQEFGNDTNVVLLSYSVTPWRDSVPKLLAYAEANKIISPEWHLLTGDKAAIYTLARKSYFAEEDLGFSRDSSNFLHTEHILLVDRDLRIRGIYNGTLQLEAEQLLKDVKELLKE